jgi:hypothetical protein
MLIQREGFDGSYFLGRDFANMIISSIRQYLGVLKSYNAGVPVYAVLSLCDVSRSFLRFVGPDGASWLNAGPLRHDLINLPSIVIESFGADVPGVMRPALNTLWNTFGFLRCDMYDGQGKWLGT